MYCSFAISQVQRWEGHRRGVNAAAYGPTTGYAYTAGRDLTICQWSRREAAVSRSFEGHSLNIAALALSPDERLLVSGARDTSVRLWDTNSGAQVAMNETPRNLVTALRWIPGEASSVLQASEDLRLRVWDVRSSGRQQPAGLKATSTMLGHSNIPLSCDVSGDGLSFLTCHKGFDGTGCELRVWDRRQEKTRQVLRGHQQAVQSCAFVGSIAGKYAISGGSDKTLRLWDCSGSAGETAAPPSACLDTHYFPSPVQSVATLSAPPVLTGGGVTRAEGFDLCFDDEEAPPVQNIEPVQIAVGCFDGSLHLVQVNIGTGDQASSGFSLMQSSGGEAGYSSGNIGHSSGGGNDDNGSHSSGGGSEFSKF